MKQKVYHRTSYGAERTIQIAANMDARTISNIYDEEPLSTEDAAKALVRAFAATALQMRMAAEGRIESAQTCAAPARGGVCGLMTIGVVAYCDYHRSPYRFRNLATDMDIAPGDVHVRNKTLLERVKKLTV